MKNMILIDVNSGNLQKVEAQPVEEEKPKKHYRLCPVAIEDIEETPADYAEDERGKRFIASIERAKDFTAKKDTGGLLFTQLEYIHALTCKNAWDGLLTMYNVAYRRGYNRAKATARK